MSHYDCSNCGHPNGVDWGECVNCTSLVILENRDHIQALVREIRRLVPSADITAILELLQRLKERKEKAEYLSLILKPKRRGYNGE